LGVQRSNEISDEFIGTHPQEHVGQGYSEKLGITEEKFGREEELKLLGNKEQ
jgi:hypothetical protein